MRRTLASLALILASASAVLAQKIVFMPQWTPQAQFAGYYIAQEKGFYREEGLDVEIRHPKLNSKVSAFEELAKGKVDLCGGQLCQAMKYRDAGLPFVNVMQLTQSTGLCCVANRPLRTLKDLNGLTIARWPSGFSEIAEYIQSYLGLDIKWIPFLNGVNGLIAGAVDATLCYSYSELKQYLLSTGSFSEENVLRFSECGYNYAEDGVYTTEKLYRTDKGSIEKFIRASRRGWDYAREHPGEAIEITMKNVSEANVNTNKIRERLMLEEYLMLQINPLTGIPDYAPITEESFEKVSRGLAETGIISREIKYDEIIR